MDAASVSHAFPSGATIRLVQGDITAAEVDAIVNAANAHLQHGGGVAAAISRRGGPTIQQESDAWVRQHGPITADRPALTSGGALPSRHVIHVVGPVWGEGDEDAKLSRAVTGALDLAESHHLENLALPAVSTGIFGFPKDRAAEVILGALAGYFDRHSDTSLRRVDVTLYDGPTVQAFIRAFRQIWPG
ncbi:MAG TPA: macro domain-containing protein [Anaerolineales bacterium]|nr:macro domain-containing protein [Anaerolineales bacterium]